MTRACVLLPLALASLLLVSACGKEDFKRTSKRGADDPMAANLKDLGKPSADRFEELAPREAPASRKTPRRKKSATSDAALAAADEFTDRDFIESEQESRDPFRNLLVKETAQTPAEAILPGDAVYLQEYTVRELKVSGIVGGPRRSAMVIDPRTGRGTILHRRDQIGRERAVIFEINRDHIVLLVPREKATPEDPYERKAIYVDEQRKIVDIGSEALRPDETGIRIFSHRQRAPASSPRKEP